jgi:cell wall-associated NlpC family hydrolase
MQIYKTYKYIFYSILLASINLLGSFQQKGVIKYPIIEMNDSFPPTPHDDAVSPDITNKNCRRSHQGLYNELVDILEEKDNALKISFKDVSYTTNGTLSTFWTEKQNILLVSDVEDSNILETIPHSEYDQDQTIVLTYPWKNFSVGTRFKRKTDFDSDTSYGIVKADYIDNQIIFDSIPHENAIEEKHQDPTTARALFVKNINDLITRVSLDTSDSIIPYVWGGSSFFHAHKDTDFYKKNGSWERKEKKNMYTGYDCSEFVMRMAKVAGIDFPWKTTTAIQQNQKALTKNDILEDGDLIWIQGHVMIISSIEANELIEARGYSSGYGCIHRIKLRDAFEDILNYDDLLQRYYNNQSLNLKNKQGDFYLKADNFLLLKLIN